jgi:arylsulfatase A
MQTKITRLLLTALLALGISNFQVNAQKPKKRPNIVVILSDDVGFEEYGIYKVKKGEKSNTPIVDKLGEEGVAFKTAYAQSICGPSRAMLYSGTYAATNGAYDNKVYYDPTNQRKDKDKYANFIRVLHDAGYKTAVSGKWHNPIGGILGVDNELLGVDQYMVYNSQPKSVEKITGDVLTPNEDWEIAAISKQPILSRYWRPAYVKDGKLLETTMEDYGPDILSDYICDFIKDNAKSDQPFLAFYPMVLAHSSHCVTPIDVAEGMEKSNVNHRHRTETGQKIFKNQIKYADNLVGKILKTIEKSGIENETIVIFTSDNGTTSSAKSKGVEYGVHIPFMVKGPGIKKRGLTDELIDFADVLPTLAEFAGTTVPSKYKVDGKSAAPFLTGKSDTTKEAIYAQPGLASIVRTKEYLLEAVCPLYGHPKGRFYKTNGSFDGRGYENITHNTTFTTQRSAFDDYLDFMSSKLPTSFEDPLWKGKLKTGFKHFNSKQQRRSHLRLPLNYQFYDPLF